MSGAFSAARKVFHDNYVQYVMTDEPRYRKAYEEAEKSMQSVIQSLKREVAENSTNLPDPSELKNLKSHETSLKYSFMKEKDALVEAQMRGAPLDAPPTPSMTSRYITIGVLGATSLLLGLL
jgi:hypothetical protein